MKVSTITIQDKDTLGHVINGTERGWFGNKSCNGLLGNMLQPKPLERGLLSVASSIE
jgi:hypothetical protein